MQTPLTPDDAEHKRREAVHWQARTVWFTESEVRGTLAEFLASLFFVFFGVGSVVAAKIAVGPAGVVEPINYATSFGFMITLLAFSIGDISGGHINPAVTLSLALSGNITAKRACMYLPAQFLGGIVGGLILHGAVGPQNYVSGIGLANNIDGGQGFLIEFMGTLVLLFTVYNTAVWAANIATTDMTDSVVSAVAPIPIGFSVLVAHLVLGPLTGCGINPMRVLGGTVPEHHDFWDSHTSRCFWIYFVGPFAASLVAPLIHLSLYSTTRAGEHVDKDAPPVVKGDKAERGKGASSSV